jgi:hypothetical protein
MFLDGCTGIRRREGTVRARVARGCLVLPVSLRPQERSDREVIADARRRERRSYETMELPPLDMPRERMPAIIKRGGRGRIAATDAQKAEIEIMHARGIGARTMSRSLGLSEREIRRVLQGGEDDGD